MRKRDIELIAALAEGRLEDETEARALIESSPSLRAEYEAQKLALDVLSSVPDARLTDAEQTLLHREIWTSLRTPVYAGSRQGTGLKLGYAAAGLVLIVGLMAVIGQITQDADQTETLGEVTAGPTSDGGEEDVETATTMSTAMSGNPPEAAEGSGDEELASYARDAKAGTLQYMAIGDMAAEESEAVARCVETAGVTDHEVTGQFEEGDSTYAMLVPVGEAIGEDTEIVFVDLETCQVAYRDN